MKKLITLLFFLQAFSGLCQNVSNEGRAFYIPFPSHDPSTNLANISIFVTSKFETEASVFVGKGAVQTKKIPANTAVKFDIVRDDAYIDFLSSNKVLVNKLIQVSVPTDKPKVAVYAHIYAGARSAASLILPYEALGQSYYSMNYYSENSKVNTADTRLVNYRGNFLVLGAVEDNTKLNIYEKNGNVLNIILSKGELYQYTSGLTNDLTGIFVEVNKESNCKRFLAFSGVTSAIVGCRNSRDPFYQQLYPVSSWGKEYGIVPFIDRQIIIRILAKEDQTKYTYNEKEYLIEKAGTYHDHENVNTAGYVIADKPVSIAQYAYTQACSSASGKFALGDPEMVLLNPVEFGIHQVTMFSSTLEHIEERYTNVVMETKNTGSFKLNGMPITQQWNNIPSNPKYSYVQFPINELSNNLTANGDFNALAYGFGNVESYAYSAGTSLASIQYLKLENTKTNIESSSACMGSAYTFKIFLKNKVKSLILSFEDGSTITDSNPIIESVKENGIDLYKYTIHSSKVFNNPGIEQIKITTSSVANECNPTGEEEFIIEIPIYSIPNVDFTFDPVICSGKEISFKDVSTVESDIYITKWMWDFGDGNYSDIQNPTHTYDRYGSFTVKLYLETNTGCNESFKTYLIKVFSKPIAKFKAINNFCVNRNIACINESVAVGVNSSLLEWHWDFGDGTPIAIAYDATVPAHAYASAGKYKISLMVISNEGCKSDIFEEEIEIAPLPVVDFVLPIYCLDDLEVKFVNLSLNEKGTSAELTYLWNFGDPYATSINNSSRERDGKHVYSKEGDYIVKLTVKNEIKGCEIVLEKKFTVNGPVKEAEFTIENDQSCSKNAVIIRNKSTVYAGKINKLDIYPDFENKPEVFFTILDERMISGEVDISIKYASFGGNSEKHFQIKMIAYSGNALSCRKEIIHTLTLKPTPILEFLSVSPFCVNDSPVQITQASELSGMLNGSFLFSGKGINAKGLFDPKAAGIGEHAITFSYTSELGCTELIKQNIFVFENPSISAGSDIFILEDGEMKTNSISTGSNLKYKWTPAIGLDRDDILNPLIKAKSNTEYTITVTNENGCSASDKIKVTVLKEIKPFNSFTPNGDGVNDVWNISYINSYPNTTVEIFNRYGKRVFYSKGYTVPFDGTYKNEPLPVGTYYYLINPNNGKKIIAGDVTIIR